MRKTYRLPLSPNLKRFKFYFDLLKRTTDDYLFLADMQENMKMFALMFLVLLAFGFRDLQLKNQMMI
jgi:hypothetical protein